MKMQTAGAAPGREVSLQWKRIFSGSTLPQTDILRLGSTSHGLYSLHLSALLSLRMRKKCDPESLALRFRHAACVRLDTDCDDGHLSAIVSHCTSMTSLNLSMCAALTDAAVTDALQRCTTLRQLCLRGCYQLSIAAMASTPRAKPLVLECIDVSGCTGISVEILGQLFERQPGQQHRLRALSVCHVPRPGAVELPPPHPDRPHWPCDSSLSKLLQSCGSRLHTLELDCGNPSWGYTGANCEALEAATLHCCEISTVALWNCVFVPSARMQALLSKASNALALITDLVLCGCYHQYNEFVLLRHVQPDEAAATKACSARSHLLVDSSECMADRDYWAGTQPEELESLDFERKVLVWGGNFTKPNATDRMSQVISWSMGCRLQSLSVALGEVDFDEGQFAALLRHTASTLTTLTFDCNNAHNGGMELLPLAAQVLVDTLQRLTLLNVDILGRAGEPYQTLWPQILGLFADPVDLLEGGKETRALQCLEVVLSRNPATTCHSPLGASLPRVQSELCRGFVDACPHLHTLQIPLEWGRESLLSELPRLHRLERLALYGHDLNVLGGVDTDGNFDFGQGIIQAKSPAKYGMEPDVKYAVEGENKKKTHWTLRVGHTTAVSLQVPKTQEGKAWSFVNPLDWTELGAATLPREMQHSSHLKVASMTAFPAVPSAHTLVELARKHGARLRVLDLSTAPGRAACPLDSALLDLLLRLCPRLHSLSLANCASLCDDAAEAIIRASSACPDWRLSSLSLVGTQVSEEAVVRTACAAGTRLRALYADFDTGQAMACAAAACPQLRVLAQCEAVGIGGIALSVARSCPELRRWEYAGADTLREDVKINVARLCPRLRSFGCVNMDYYRGLMYASVNADSSDSDATTISD